MAAVPGVERVSTEAWWAAQLESEISNEHPEAFLTGIYTSAGPRSRERVVAGRYPAADEPNGVVVNDEAVRRMQWRPGSVVRLRTVSPDRFAEWAGNDGSLESVASYDGPTIDAVVTGVVRSEEDFLEDREPALLLTEAFARAYGDQVAHVVPTMAIRADPDRVDAVAAQLRPILDAYNMDVFPAERTDVAVAPSISVEVTTLEIAAVIAALAGLVVVAQATGRQVVAIGEQQQVRAALGMTRDARIVGSWLAVAPAMVVGALAAPALAWAVSGLFPRGVARRGRATARSPAGCRRGSRPACSPRSSSWRRCSGSSPCSTRCRRGLSVPGARSSRALCSPGPRCGSACRSPPARPVGVVDFRSWPERRCSVSRSVSARCSSSPPSSRRGPTWSPRLGSTARPPASSWRPTGKRGYPRRSPRCSRPTASTRSPNAW